MVSHISKGGTVGDIESAPFIHAISQLQRRAGKGNFVQIHVSYVPMIPCVYMACDWHFPPANNVVGQDLVVSKRLSRPRGPLAMFEALA